MSRSPRTRRTGVAAIGVVIGALALAGCGAGQITQTDTQVSAVNGAQATVGAMAIRDARFEYTATASASVYPTGGNAPLKMTVVNSAGTDDKLVAATSPVARSVRVTGTTVIPSGRVLLVDGATAAAAAPTSDAAPAAQIVLVGVTQEIRPGLTYPVTLTFQKAGAVTVQVPVGNPTTPRTESAPA